MLWFSVDCFISQGREAGEAEPLTATEKDKLWHGVRGSFPPDPCLAASVGFGVKPQGFLVAQVAPNNLIQGNKVPHPDTTRLSGVFYART